MLPNLSRLGTEPIEDGSAPRPPKRQREEKYRVCVQINVEKGTTFRSPTGPIMHDVHVAYVNASPIFDDEEPLANSKAALKEAVSNLQGAYQKYERFMSTSRPFLSESAANHLEPMAIYQVKTPEKNAPDEEAAAAFVTNLANAFVALAPATREFLDGVRRAHLPSAPPPKADLSALDAL